MSIDRQQELVQAHKLLDRLPPAKLGAVRSLLEVMLDDNEEEEPVTEEDRTRFHQGQAWFAQRDGKGILMEEVLADFGLSVAASLNAVSPIGENGAALRQFSTTLDSISAQQMRDAIEGECERVDSSKG